MFLFLFKDTRYMKSQRWQ